MSAFNQAELLKEQGNLCFKKEKYLAAIDAYTEAIAFCPNVPVYWTNRALCHRKRGNWKSVESDSKQAVELDTTSVKGHYMLGLALLHLQKHAEGVKKLEKALELGRAANPSSSIVEEVWAELCKAKYSQWESAAAHRKAKQKEIREICERALKLDYENAVAEESSGDTPMPDVILVDDSSGDEDDGDQRVRRRQKLEHRRTSSEAYQEKLQALGEIFNKAAEKDVPTDVPDYLCCQITMEIFKDPVITPSGVTYERTVLLEHLNRVGKFDPITRASLDAEQLVNNLALKEAVQAYLLEHGWAYKSSDS